ncbi:mannosyl oligosaccharide glucosidase [Echinococcus multilocularis]|uniref:Mannosyl-oligosaccharide glucosidase n=1 Tax=Echinococcus multilocularis TaxID=6211 RepID=A0A068XTA5_ECHMU|nr:mannosyl oligosaccharide glucosidase [Echinococcus multilocularis]
MHYVIYPLKKLLVDVIRSFYWFTSFSLTSLVLRERRCASHWLAREDHTALITRLSSEELIPDCLYSSLLSFFHQLPLSLLVFCLFTMGKGKIIEDKPRHQKSNSSNGVPKNVVPAPNYKNVAQLAPEKSRIRRPHRKTRAGLFGDFGSELYRRLIMGASVIIFIAVLLHFGVEYSQNMRQRRQVYTPINLPKMIGPNEVGPEHSPELFWGTYRPGIFFGMSHRSPHSMLFGLAWVTSDGKSVQFRHRCTNEGDIKSYNWIEHDGRNYGIEQIIAGNHNITVAFVKRPATPNGGDWSVRISVSSVNDLLAAPSISFLFYAYLPDSTRGRIQSYTNGNELKRLRGFTQELGAFQVNFHTAKGSILNPTHLVGHCPREDALVAAISSGLVLREDRSSVFFTGDQVNSYAPETKVSGTPTNLWVTEVTRPAIRAIRPNSPAANGGDTHYRNQAPLDVLEVEFISQASTSSDAVPLVGLHFNEALNRYSKRFHEAFLRKFPYDPLTINEKQMKLARISLSNMLGGVGYFYGTSLINSPLLGAPISLPKPNSTSIPSVEYWPSALFTATPSRDKFPHGFLWDEGFHALLIARWDVELALQSLGHWLDLLNMEGWIPREQILGWDARANVPPEFIVQSTTVANPPALILVVEYMLDHLETHMSVEEAALFDRWARIAFPRLRAWFVWFTTTQAGELPTAFRWRGRSTHNPFQLNPLTLASGLDDYPRASHPTASERHLDLRCWMAAFARTLARLAEHFEGHSSVSSSSSAEEYRSLAAQLLDPRRLDELHWDEANGIYADFGLHTDEVTLVSPPVTHAPLPGQPMPQKERQVLREPREQWVASSLGYVSFFPLFLRLLPPASPRLPALLQLLAHPALFSPHGLRSLALISPLYNRANTQHDPPYWRGAVWINMNYLAIEALKYYARHPETPASVAEKAANLQKSLTVAIVDTVLGELNRTGFTWERYDDQTGRGLSAHPFNGWTALISLIMTEETTTVTVGGETVMNFHRTLVTLIFNRFIYVSAPILCSL